MTDYHPDAWIIIRIEGDAEPLDKVLGGWYGGFAGADSWRLNSGIVEIRELEEKYEFVGSTGSVYHCWKRAERASICMSSVLAEIQDYAETWGRTVTVIPATAARACP